MSQIVAMANDYEVGLIPGWPDEYAGPVVEGVRLLMLETARCARRLSEEAVHG